MLAKTLALALGLLLSTTHATSEFTNHGTKSGWSSLPAPEADGTVQEVTNVVFRGSTALKMTQTFKDGYTGRYHSEVTYKNGYRRGETKYYGLAFRLSDSWDFAGTQSFNIAQFIADFGDTGCDDYSPTTMVYLRGNTLYTRVKTGQLLAGKECSQPTRKITLKSGIQGGVWYSLILQVNWQSDNTGSFNAWIDGTKVFGEGGIATTVLDDRREFQFRVGLYANGWHDDEGINPSDGQRFRQVWIDEVGVGSAKADVDPQLK